MNIFLDGSFIGYRSLTKYCGRLGYRSTKGRWIPTGTIFSFFRDVRTLLERYPKTKRIAVAWDSYPQYRQEISSAYKAQRKKDKDPEFYRLYIRMKKQLKELKLILPSSGIEQYICEGFEADDVLATLAKRTKGDVALITSDKDLQQCIRKNVWMYDFNRTRNLEWFTEEYGIKPVQWIEVQALTGDGVDNVEGIKGVGVKTAIKLLNSYGDAQGFLDSGNPLAVGNIQTVELARRLVELKTDLDLDYTEGDLDFLKFRRCLVQRQMRSILKGFSSFRRYARMSR